ncbi:MAG: hypothetical protein JST22_09885 [Bacteroidetes bacterium]|nr:hypothetical protein [Bacteroidota bacterium]
MNRKFHFRALGLAAIVAMAALIAPSAVRAQDAIVCQCDSITVINNTNCTATICILSAVVHCHDFGAGTKTRVPCQNATGIGIRDCSGTLHQITPSCVSLPIAPNCCVRACLEQSAAGCYTITIDPSPILCICQ